MKGHDMKGTRAIVGLLVTLLAASTAAAHGPEPDVQPRGIGLPAPMREIGFDQNLNHQLPLDAPFVDSEGRQVHLGDYFGKVPVVLAFAYYNCTMLCTQVMNDMAATFDVLGLQPGKDYEALTISFDPTEKPPLAAAKKAETLTRFKQPGAAGAWHFLTGDEPTIERVTKAAGFRYVWDKATNQWAHPTGIIVLTPQGRIARYLFGIEYGPRDLRFAIMDASSGHIGSLVDSVLLACFHYDPTTGRYSLAIFNTMRVAGAVTVLVIVGGIAFMLRQEKQRNQAARLDARTPSRGPEPLKPRA
jgi:protein SCO1